MGTILVADAVALFLESAKQTVARVTYDNYKRYCERFAEKFGARTLDSLTPDEVRTWGRTYHAVQAVQRLVNWAKYERRLITGNPLERMRKMPRGRRLRILQPRETAAMMRGSKSHFRRLLMALRESIARPGELRRATWDDVRTTGMQPFTPADLIEGKAFIFLDSFKARDTMDDRYTVRVIPISPRLGRMLARLYDASADRHGEIFRNRFGKPWTVNAVICRLRRLRERYNLKADHRKENIVAYSMRHTGATSAICEGMDIATLGAIMGHTDIRMTNRYLHLAPDHLAKALGKVTEAKSARKRKNDAPTSPRIDPDSPR